VSWTFPLAFPFTRLNLNLRSFLIGNRRQRSGITTTCSKQTRMGLLLEPQPEYYMIKSSYELMLGYLSIGDWLSLKPPEPWDHHRTASPQTLSRWTAFSSLCP